MYELYVTRVISGENRDFLLGEFNTLEQCANNLHMTFWLDAYVIGLDGTRYKLVEEEDGDYMKFSFVVA